ncbi:hypothetical protein IG631_04991 [Alternaria alternata]|nr:hypothetical protein IG631_04991 [Alternaria alternata]
MASGALPDLWATPLAQYRLAKEPQYVSVRGNMMSERRSDPCGNHTTALHVEPRPTNVQEERNIFSYRRQFRSRKPPRKHTHPSMIQGSALGLASRMSCELSEEWEASDAAGHWWRKSCRSAKLR